MTRQAPQGLRIVHADGSSTPPIEVKYAGEDADGCHVWVPVDDTYEFKRGDRITVEVLPSKTTIQVRMAPPWRS